jgi:hypothetical protein
MTRRVRVPRTAVQLRPSSAAIEPGTILFLRQDQEARSLRCLTDLDQGALGHPCVVVSPRQDCDYVRILIV